MTEQTPYQWIKPLALRYSRATSDPKRADPNLIANLQELNLASAVLDKLRMMDEQPPHATHIAVIGPTQSGKSTLVNLLLDAHAARVSPLAGFTVHSQCYGRDVSADDILLVQRMLAPLQRTPAAELDAEQLDSYVLETVSTGPHSLVDDALVWDSPDFDSISAGDYSLAVLKTAAIADVCILTLSKDKYGDQRVWDMLALLIGLGKSLLICINKVDDADRRVIQAAFATRFHDVFNQPLPPLVMLPFVRGNSMESTLSVTGDTRLTLQHALHEAMDLVDRHAQKIHFSEFVANREARWLQPLLAQLDAQEQWNKLIDAAISEADEYYARQYLDSPDKYDSFNRALAELLSLLEIPGVANRLVQARQIITWPARRLLGVGRQALNQKQDARTDALGDVMDQEALVLDRMLDNVLISLQRQLLEAQASPWWHALDNQLRTALPSIRRNYLIASKQARHSFEPEIEKAAAQLYEQLQKQPALLNSLRVARFSADAAAVAFAVKSGGLAPTDLVLAPAMLSVTTLLTESALGRYLDTIKLNLKRRQRVHMKEQVLQAALQDPLVQLSDELSSPELFAGNLEPVLSEHLGKFR